MSSLEEELAEAWSEHEQEIELVESLEKPKSNFMAELVGEEWAIYEQY